MENSAGKIETCWSIKKLKNIDWTVRNEAVFIIGFWIPLLIYCPDRFYGGDKSMEKLKSKKAGQKTDREKIQFTVVREFAGSQTIQEAFEQLIEKQAYEYFEK